LRIDTEFGQELQIKTSRLSGNCRKDKTWNLLETTFFNDPENRSTADPPASCGIFAGGRNAHQWHELRAPQSGAPFGSANVGVSALEHPTRRRRQPRPPAAARWIGVLGLHFSRPVAQQQYDKSHEDNQRDRYDEVR
jgi:hypothetical protein